MTVPPKRRTITRLILSAHFLSPIDLIKHHQGYLEKWEGPEASLQKLSRMDNHEVNCGIVFTISVVRGGGCYGGRGVDLIYATFPENDSWDIPSFLHNSELCNSGIPWAQGVFSPLSSVFKIINTHYIASSVFLVLSICMTLFTVLWICLGPVTKAASQIILLLSLNWLQLVNCCSIFLNWNSSWCFWKLSL